MTNDCKENDVVVEVKVSDLEGSIWHQGTAHLIVSKAAKENGNA